MAKHNWKNTSWSDGLGNTTTIHDVLLELQNDPVVELELSALAHIPSTYLEEPRVTAADLSCPIIVQQLGDQYQSILDGHHRRQRAKEENRKYILAKVFKGKVINEVV